MNSFWRFTFLGVFSAAGVAMALGVAASGPRSSAEVHDQPARAATLGAKVVTLNDSAPATAQAVAVPIYDRPNPPIAMQSTAPSQTEMMQALRDQFERALKRQAEPVAESASQSQPSKPKLPPPRITKAAGEGDDKLSINIQDADLRDVLEMLSQQGGLNILPSPGVQGKVSASLQDVDIDTALEAILRSTGFLAHREGKFIYVGSPKDFDDMRKTLDKVATRVYRLNYIRAADVQALVQPLLTPQVGSISVTAPAEEGIAPDDTQAGGNQFAGGDSVLVHDYVAVLDQVDQVIAEVDRKPAQVAIEAMILSVTLDDAYTFGVDLEFFRNNPHVRLATGTPLQSLNNLDLSKGGLKFAFLDSNTGAFISALETIGDTNVIASPRLMVVNKARAEILIGEQLGYVNTTITETSTAQNVQFLEVGAQLRLRPFIASDGLIRMEVHPELSTGTVQVRGQFTLPEKRVTQVTTNIMVPDGCTVIIGGLMREDITTTQTQVPLLGSLPLVGVAFRNKTEKLQKREILVLITPHIVCEPDACCEGDKAAAEFHRRQAVYADQMSPISKRYLGRRYYRLAQAAWANGDREAALRMIDLSVHFDPENRAAIDLRVDIWNGNMVGDHTLVKPGMFPPGPLGALGVPAHEIPEGELIETPYEIEPTLAPPEAMPESGEYLPGFETAPVEGPSAKSGPPKPPGSTVERPAAKPKTGQQDRLAIAPLQRPVLPPEQKPDPEATINSQLTRLRTEPVAAPQKNQSTPTGPELRVPGEAPVQPQMAAGERVRQAAAQLDAAELPSWLIDDLRNPAAAPQPVMPPTGAPAAALLPPESR